MQITQFYSHLNGYEHIRVHQRRLWREISQVITAIDAASCLTKVSNEKTKQGRTLYSPVDLRDCIKSPKDSP